MVARRGVASASSSPKDKNLRQSASALPAVRAGARALTPMFLMAAAKPKKNGLRRKKD
jgi:hypothetical protein